MRKFAVEGSIRTQHIYIYIYIMHSYFCFVCGDEYIESQ